MENIYGTIVLKESVKSKMFGVTYPADVELKAFCDDMDRIYVEHPKDRNIFRRVFKGNIKSSSWKE